MLLSVLWHCWPGVRKSIQPVKIVMWCWCGYLSGARGRLIAHGPADAAVIPKLHHLLHHINPERPYLSGTSVHKLSWKKSKKVKVGHTRLPSVGLKSWSWFLAVSLHVTWVTNPAVGCHYFPPGLQLPPQPLRGLLPISLHGEQGHNGREQFA